MKYFTQICTLIIFISSAHFAQAQCPVPASAVAFTASANNVCAQTDVTFTVTNPDPGYVYTWDFGDPSSTSNSASGTVATHSFSPNSTGGTHNVKVTASPPSNSPQVVTWANVHANITTFGNSLYKTSGSDYDTGGAESSQSVMDNMYVEFLAGLTSNRLTCGLGNNSNDDSRNSIDFGIETYQDGTIRIYENGTYKHNAGSYVYGDTLRVSSENSVVKYYKNGGLVYTSTISPSFPMFADVAVKNSNDTLHSVVIGSFCFGVDSMTINTLATLNIDVSGSWNKCVPVDNLGYTQATFLINNMVSGVSYNWDFGDGNTAITTYPDSVYIHQYNAHGIYPVTVSANNGGCTGTYTNEVLYLTRPLANMVVVGTADICEGETIYVANNTNSPSVDFFVIDWGDGMQDTVTNTDTLSHVYTFTDAFACTITQGGQPYDITLYAINSCFEHTNESPITVIANPRSTPSSPDIVCEHVNTTAGVSFGSSVCPAPVDIFSNVYLYNWNFGDPASGGTNTSFSQNPNHVFTGPGSYDVILTITEPTCGNYYDTMTVRILDDPAAGFSFTTNPIIADPTNGDGCAPIDVIFNNNVNGDSVTYNWTIQTNVIGGANFINGTSDTSINPQMEFILPGDYIITLTATNPCTTTTQIDTIIVLDGPKVTLSSTNPTCDIFLYTPDVLYDEGGGAISTYNWTFPGAVPATSNAANPTNILYSNPGTYEVIVEITNECTVTSDTITFYIPFTPDPVTLSANGNQNTCIDAAAFNLSVDSTGGTWFGTGITNSTNGTFNPILAGVGTHTVSYIYNPRVCPDTSTIDITVNDLPVVSASGDTSLCYNDGLMTLGGETPTGGTWAGVGITDVNLGTFDPTVSGAGVFPVVYTYTDGNGCTNTDLREVRVFSLPALNAGNDIVECLDPDDVALSAAPNGGTWSGPGITDPTGIFNSQSTAGVGTYDVFYDYTDGNGCTNQDTLEIDVIAGTVVDAGNDTTVCISSNPLELIATPSNGVWVGTGVFNNSGYFFFPSVADVGSYDLVYSRGSGSCEEKDSFNITVLALPVVEAGVDLAICVSDDPFNLTGNSPASGTWSGTGITDVNAGTFNPAIGEGTYILTYSYTDPVSDCINTDTRTVVVNPLPNVSTAATVIECNNVSDIQLAGYSPGGGVWTGSGIINATLGTFNTGSAGGLGFNNGDTTYSLVYTYTDPNGCIDSSGTTVTVTFGDTVEAGPDNILCINNGAFALTGFSPNDGTGSWTGAGVAGTNFFPSAAGLGIHTLTYTYGVNSCEKSDTKTIEVISIPGINAGNDTTVCQGTDPFALVAFFPNSGTWSGTGISGNIFDPLASGTGMFTLTYTYENLTTGCRNTDTKVITVATLPVVTTNGTDLYCVSPSNVTLTNYNPAGGIWTGAGIVNANSGIFNSANAGGLAQNSADTLYSVVYTYTDGNGCSNNDTLKITIEDGEPVEAGPLDTVCQYDAAFIINGFSPAGGTWTGTGITNSNTGQFNPGVVIPGTYEVIYTINAGSLTCKRSDTTFITVGATPVVNAGLDTLVCEATAIFTLYNATPVGGIWSGNGVVGNTFNPVTAGTGTHTLSYEYTNVETGCLNSDIKIVTVSALPNVITTGPVQECTSPDDITLVGYTPTGGTWAGTGIVDASNGIFNGQTAGGVGTYNLTYTYTDVNGCIDSSLMQLSVVDSVSVSAGGLDTVCQYDAPFIINGFSPANGVWAGSGISNSNTGQFNPGSVVPGTYPVIYTIGSGTCERSDTTSIFIVPTPNVEAGINITICADSTSFTLTGNSPADGVWSGTGITDSIAGVFDPQVAGAGTHVITYTYFESINGCQNSDTRTIQINPLPIVTLANTAQECISDDNVTLAGYSPAGGTWTGTGIVNANSGLFNGKTAGGVGTYELIYTYTDGNGCTNMDTMSLSVVDSVSVEAGPLDTVCAYDAPFTINGFTPANGIWTGSGISNSNTGQFNPGSVAPGIYPVIYTIGSGTCERSDTTSILIVPTPNVEAGINITVCADSMSFTLTGNSPANGVWSGIGITDSITGVFDPQIAGVGTHVITYTYFELINGCQNSDTRTIQINPLPIVTLANTAQECISDDNATLSGYSPAGGTWSGTGIVNANSGLFNGQTAGGVGIYELIYTYTDGNGCTNMDTMSLSVVDSVSVEAGPLDTVCTYDAPFTINGFTPSNGIWTGTGISNSNTGQFDPGSVAPGTYPVIYTIGSGTCERSDTTSILIVPTPTVNAGGNITICADDPITLTGFSPIGGIWSGTGQINPSSVAPGIYELTYTYFEPINGCENSDTKTININSLPVVTMPDTLMYCNSGGDITLAGYTPTGGLWSGSGITDVNSGVFNTVTAGGIGYNNADTTYPLLYIYTDVNGCIDSADLNVILIFGDTINAGPDLAMCITDNPDTLTSYVPISGGTWAGQGITNATLGIFDPGAAGAGNWTLTYTFGTGTCLKQDTRDVLVGDIPNVLAGNDLEYCISEPQDTLTGFSPPNGVWSGTGITDTLNGYFDPATAGDNSHLITYTFTHPVTGCVNLDTRILDVNPLPPIDAGDTVRYCDNPDNITLLNYSPLGGTWSGQGIIDANNGIFNTTNAGGLGANNASVAYPVIYTVTSGDGCVDNDTLIVIVEFGDTVDAGGPFGVCIDDGLVTLSNLTPAFTPSTGGIWTGAGIIDGVNGIFDPTTVATSTSIDIVYTYGVGTCRKVDSTTIFVGEIPQVEAGANDTVCSADPAFTMTGFVPNSGGIWSGQGITNANTGVFDPSVAGVGTWTLAYTYTNEFTGCENSDTKLMTVRPAPVVNAGNDRTECNNSTDITLSGYSPLGGVWSGAGIIDANNGIFNSIIAGGVGPNNTAVTHTLTYFYTDGIGCTNSDVMLFTIEFGDTVLAGADFNICEDAGLQNLTGLPAGGTWSGTGIINPNGIFDPSVPTPGSFYTLTYTFGIGTCQKTDDLQFFVSPTITVNAGPDVTVCLTNVAFNLTGNSPSGGGVWSGTGITDVNVGTFDPTIAGVGIHVITFDYVNAVTGCEGSDTREVSVVNVPVASVGGPVTFCDNVNNITISDYVVFSPAGGVWSGSGVVDGINGIFNTSSAGGLGFNNTDTTYQITYTYSSGASCTDTETLDITVIFGDIVEAGLNDTLCIDDAQITFTGASPVGGTWSGNGIVDGINGVFDPSVATAGLHIITYTFGTGTCQKIDTKTVLVGALPVINPGANDVVCIDNGMLTLSGYSPQGGIWSGTGIADGNAGTFDPTTGTGTYTLRYRYTNPITGCDSSVTKTVIVNPLPNVTAPDSVEYCNTTADISLSGLAAPNGGTWTGTGVTDANGTFNASVAGGIGAYTITYSFTGGNGCENTADMVVNIILGDIVYAGVDDTLCIDDGQITLVGSPLGGVWSGNGIIDANLGIFNPATATAGLHTLTYTFGVGTCEKTDDVTILIGALPIINPGANDVVCIDNGILTLSGYSPQGGIWSGTGITNGNTGTFDPAITGMGTFTLTYIYANPVTGCDSSVTKTVTVNPLPTVNATDVTFCDNINDISLAGLGAPNGGTWSGNGIVDANGLFNSNIAGGIGIYTLTYTFTNSNGCTNSDNMDVNIIYGDTVEAGPDLAMCVTDGLIDMADFSPLGGTWSGNGIIDANNGTFDPTQVTAGFHTLTYTFGTGSCLKTDTRDIFVGEIPAVVAGPDIVICQQADSITISTGSPAGGYWQGVGIDSTGGFVPQNMGIGTFNLAYTYVNSVSGCQNTDTLAITVEAPPAVDAGTDVVYCNTNQNITLAGYTPVGGLWNGAGIVDGINGIFNTQTAGGLGYNDGDTTYQLVYTFTSNGGCFNRDTLDITVEFGEFVDAGQNDTICINNGQFVLSGYTPNGGTWSGVGITDPNLGIFDPLISGTGTHTLTYTFGVGTCQKSDTKTIFVDALPNVSAGVDEMICINNGILTLINYTPQGGVWSGTGITDPNVGTFDPTISNLGVFTLTYTYANPITGCSASDTKLVEVTPLPNVTATDTVEYCNTTTDISLSGLSSPIGGTWTGTGVTNTNGTFNASIAGGIGTYTLTYSFTDGNGCENTADMTVNIIFGDTVYAGVDDTLCIDDAQITLVGSPVGGVWSGNGIVDANQGIFDPATATAGLHTLSYTFGTGTCEKTDDVTILVGALPIINPGGNDVVCIDNGMLTFSAYSPQGGVWSGTGIVDGNAGTFDPSIGAGTYTVTYTYANPVTDCDNSVTKTVTVNPLPNVTAGGTVTYCNTPDQITIADYSTFSPQGGVWSGAGIVDANGIFSTIIAGGLSSDGSDTTYNLTYTYADGNGCSSSDILTVTVTYGDTVVAGNNQSVCIDAGLIVLNDFSPANGTWSGAGITNTVGIFDPTAAGLGTHILTYTFGIGTCRKNATKTIFVGDLPVISAGVDQTVCIDNGLIQMQGFSPFGGVWTGTSVDSNGIFNPVIGVGSYTLTYTFINSVTNCETSDTKEVTVAPLPTVTTANTALYCDIASNITLTGYTPAGGVWTGAGIVDGSLGLFNTTQAGGLAFNGGDTTYTLTYTYTDGNGCINSNTSDITVTYGDTVVAGTNEATCIDAGLINLTGFSPAGGTFSGTGIIDAVAGVFDPAVAGGGTHVITYTFGAGTCEKESTKTIFVGTDPIVEAGPNLEYCIDEALFQLTNYSPLGGIWSGVGVTDVVNGFFDPAVAGDGVWTLTYSYTNSITGCEASDTRTVTINPLPIVTAPDTLEFCNTPINITLSGFAPLGGTWIGTGVVDQANGIFNTTIAGGVGVYDIEYRYTDVNGCTNNDSTVINVIFGDTVVAGPDLAVCISDALIILTGFQPVGGTWTGNGITDPSGVFDPQAAGAGLHTITISFGAGTCLKTDTRDIFVGEIPTVTAGSDDAICGQDADYMLTGFSPPGGYWIGNGVDSAGLFSPAGATPGTWTLTYTYVNIITGCENSDTKIVFVETPPVVDAGGTVTYCNSTNNITLNLHTPTGGVWSGAGIIDGLNGIFNTTAAGGLGFNGGDTTYFAYYEFTSGTGCFGRDTLDIIVTFGDTVYAGVDDTICIDGGQLNLAGFSPAGGTWAGNGIIDNVLGIFDPVTAGVGLHTLSYTYGIGTCEKTDNKTILVGALPVINPGIDELVCIDESSFTLSNFSPQGGYWIGVGVDSAGVFAPATAGVGTWTLTYIFTNNITGCDNSATKEITIAPLPAVNVGDTIQYCDNPNDITLSGYSPLGGSWSGDGIVSGNAGIFSTVLAGGIGIYDLTYTFIDVNGCTNRDTLVVDVIFGDTVNAGPDMSICISDGLITLNGYTPPSGGTWTGTGIVDANAGIFDPNLAGGGTHVLTYTYGVATCEKTSTRTIFVGTIPSVDAGPDVLVCEDQSAFTLNTFSPTGGLWSGTGITDSINAIFDPQLTGTGTFILVYDYVNTVTGCENFDTREVIVAPLPVVDIDDSLEFCINNNNIPLTDYVNTTPTTGLTWSGSGIVDPSNGVFNTTIAGGIGQYVVVIEYTDGNGCSNNDTLIIDVIFGDTVIAGPDDTLCINDNPILLTGFAPIGGAFSGAGVDVVSGTFDPATAGAGLHIITYTFGTGTCEKTDTRRILVGNLPSINIGPDQTVCIDGGAFTLSAYSPQGGTWAGVGITDANVGIFNIDSAGVGTHILTYTVTNSITGCENTAQRTITVAPLPVVDAGNPILICDNPDDYTIPTSSYSPNGGTWSGQGMVNASAGVFNTVIAGGLGFNNADTTYPVIYTFTDGNSCTNFDTLIITVEFGDSIYAGLNEALCIDIGLHQLTGFLPTINGLWTGPGISDPINGIFDPQAAGPGAHTLTISTGTGTCAKTDDKIIFVGTPPAVNPGNDQTVCADDTLFAFTGFSPPGGIWSGTGIVDSTNAIFDPQLTGTGTFVLTYTFVNSVTNCETVATKQVTVNPLPFIDAGDTVTYCANPNDIVLSGYTPSSGGFWSGPGITNPSQGIFSTVQAGGIGIYSLIYDYTEPFTGCENRDTLVVDVIYGDTVLAGLNDTLCIQDLPITLQGSPAGGTWTGTGITNGNLGIFNPAIAQGGTHVMTYTFGLETCEKTDTKIIFVGEPDPIDAGNDQILCIDAPAITLTASLPTGVWSGNGITNTTTGVFNPGVASVGNHNIVYTYTNSVTGCVSMDTLLIEVKPLPVVNTAGAITYCEWPLNVQLPTPNLTPGVWNGAGIVDINNGIFNGIVAGGLGSNGIDTIYPITYIHTDAFGCSNNDILNITITYGDSVLAGPDIIACIDDNPITLVGTPVNGVWSGFGITDPTGIFDPSVGIGGGNFDVIYTQGGGTCEKSDTLTITIIDVTGTTAGADEEFCYEDGLVTLTGNSPIGGVWTGPGIQDGNLGTFLTQAVSTGVNSDVVQVCYTYTDALSGCDYSDCKNVTVRPLPIVGFTVVDTACINDMITFTNTSIDAISFKWFFGDGDSSIFLTPTHVYNNSGIYPVTLIAYSDFGCPDTLTQDITIYEAPTAAFTMNTNDGCGPLTVSFVNTSINQNQDLQYSWDFGNGLTSVQSNPPAQTYNAGVEDTVYVVSLTVNNLCGMTTFTDSITVRAQPQVLFVADDNFGCGPLVVNFANGSTGGPNAYLWNFGPFGASTDTIPPPVSFTISDTFAVTYFVTLTATNACGTDIDSLPITVIPGSINAGIGSSLTEGCEPLTVDFTSAIQPGDNIQWIFGDGNGSILNAPTHVFDTVGTFTVLQIVTNQCGSDTATIDITVHPQPPMNISHAPFVCLDQPMQFYNNSNPIAGTQWIFGDGDTSTLTNPAHVYTTPGIYTVYVTNYSITHLCPITDSTIVEVKSIPNASFAIDETSGCSPLTVNFTNNSTGLFNSWMFINGSGVDTSFTITQSPTHTFIEHGQHYVVLRTSDQFGCFEDTTITGIVVYPDPVADFTPSVDQQCGLDATVTLENNSTDADAYFWDFGNGTFSNVTTPTISYNNVGDHTIFLEASNTFGCKDTLIDQITVYPAPNADFDIQPQTGCEPLTVQFVQLATNTNGYFWEFGNGETSTEANPIYTYGAGAYNVTFVASIDDVCFDTIVITDAVFAQGSPLVDFEILQSDPDNPTGVIDFINNTIGATEYQWEFGDGTFSSQESPSKEYLENGQRIVRLIAWNDEGCSDTLTKIVEPIGFKGLFVPNAFSPNAGIGDVRLFKPIGVSIATYKAQVFSQWGELLWQSEALDDAGRPTEGWDGMYKGSAMPQGAYVWKVEAVYVDGSIWEGQKNTLGQRRKLGSVTLLR